MTMTKKVKIVKYTCFVEDMRNDEIKERTTDRNFWKTFSLPRLVDVLDVSFLFRRAFLSVCICFYSAESRPLKQKLQRQR